MELNTANNSYSPSDLRLKKNISPLDPELQLSFIKLLKPI